MDLPDFSSIWHACENVKTFEKCMRNPNSQRSRGRRGLKRGRKRPVDTYYSDGICGVSFGIEQPEFSNPLRTCCDQHFFTEEEYIRHESEHIQCTITPCSLALHPSMMNFHIETVHSDDIHSCLRATLDGADRTVNTWRDSRKRNYPTFERVQAKIRETGYRIDRGQVLMTRQFGLLNSRKPKELKMETSRVSDCQLKENKNSSTDGHSTCNPLTKENALGCVKTPSEPYTPSLNSEAILSPSSVSIIHNDISNADSVANDDAIQSGSLVSCIYDSDASLSGIQSDNKLSLDKLKEPRKPDASDNSTQFSFLSQSQSENVQSSVSYNTERPMRRKQRRKRRQNRKEIMLEKADAPFASHPVVRLMSKRRECMRNTELLSKRPTLLQMLLAEDMRHERNQLMQCVRFVTKNNFFK